MWSSPAKLPRILPESFYRFLAGGIANTAISYLLYLALLRAFAYPIAYSASYVFGIGLAFVINGNFVFRSRLTIKRAAQVGGIYALQYLYGRSILWLAITVLGIDARLALGIGIVTFIPVNYSLSRLIFRKRGPLHDAVV